MAARMSRPQKRTRTPIRTVEGAGGVVINGAGRVLMIRHKNGTWVFPKGHIEPGESKTETAEREVQEEAGVAATVFDPRMTWQTDYVNPRREARRITWYLLTTDATSTVQTEALFPEGGFFPPATAMRKLAFDEDRGVLRGALKAAERSELVEAGEVAKAVHVAATTRGRASAQRDRARERQDGRPSARGKQRPQHGRNGQASDKASGGAAADPRPDAAAAGTATPPPRTPPSPPPTATAAARRAAAAATARAAAAGAARGRGAAPATRRRAATTGTTREATAPAAAPDAPVDGLIGSTGSLSGHAVLGAVRGWLESGTLALAQGQDVGGVRVLRGVALMALAERDVTARHMLGRFAGLAGTNLDLHAVMHAPSALPRLPSVAPTSDLGAARALPRFVAGVRLLPGVSDVKPLLDTLGNGGWHGALLGRSDLGSAMALLLDGRVVAANGRRAGAPLERQDALRLLQRMAHEDAPDALQMVPLEPRSAAAVAGYALGPQVRQFDR
jgi:diadenosine hexaphosphate hydrolase (ATP-forming)